MANLVAIVQPQGSFSGGPGDDTYTGTPGADTINGNGGNDILAGGAGGDTIDGGDGDDILVSADFGPSPNDPIADMGTEHDHLEGGGGNDYLAIGYGDDADGGTGVNVLRLSLGGASSGVTLDTANIITGGSYSLGGGTIVNIQAVKEITGSAFGDTITVAIQDMPVTAVNTAGVTLFGGAGDDHLTILGSVNGNTLWGDEGNDTLTGGEGNDYFYGGADADIISGGGGDDIVFITKPDEIVAGDRIDGGTGSDTLLIDNNRRYISGTLDISALSLANVENLAVTHIANVTMTATQFASFSNIYDASTNYSSTVFTLNTAGTTSMNGHSASTALNVNLANGTNVFDMSGLIGGWGSVVTGGTGNDTIIGGSGLDILTGGDGNDSLTGGDSPADPIYNRTDQLSGGRGDDHYYLTSAQVSVIENSGEGNDTVTTTFSYTLSANVESLELIGSADIDGYGNNLANIITGNSGANHLYGLDGNDMLDGGTGIDQLFGGVGDDVYHVDQQGDWAFENAGEGTDTVVSTVGYYLYPNIENLILASGAGNIFGVGNELANTITGNEGDNLLLAHAGDDTVHGGAGADTIYGEDGNDQLYGDAGDDVIVGGAGDDVLDGGTGTDQLFGGTGDDVYHVDQQGDWAFENAGEGTDTVISTASYYLYPNIENLILASGAGNIFGVGNELANTITGNEGDNLVLAHAGDDTVHGGAGADTIYGEDGNDQLYGDAGNDVIFGGAGNDMLDGGTGINLLFGGVGDDVYYGLDWAFEYAGEGNDTVISTEDYFLYPNIENLILAGTGNINGAGNRLANTITGNEGNNRLEGGGGGDVINGKAGNDWLYGDSGPAVDTFVFEHGTGVDVVISFDPGIDKIDLTAIGYSWQQVQNALHDTNQNALEIDLGNGDAVFLSSVTVSQLQQSDFILAGSSAAVTTLTARAAAPATSDLQEIDHGAMLSGLWHDGGHGLALMATL